MKTALATKKVAHDHDHEHDYSGLLLGVKSSFNAAIKGGVQLFQTDAEGLNDLYLRSLPIRHRQVHNCHACRRFIEQFGGLVTIDARGKLTPVMWNAKTVPDFYWAAFNALHGRVKSARVTGPFFSAQAVLGTPITGNWTHMSARLPVTMIHSRRDLTAFQRAAAVKQNFETVKNALSEFKAPILDQAIRLFETESLARSEKFVAPVKWLRTLHDRPRGKAGDNILWLAVATAPEGFCHPKSSVVGPLLESIAAGKSFTAIKKQFNDMLNPLQYQRPQVAPTAGNIRQAEQLFEKMGLAPALERRFARLDELETIWEPAKPKRQAAGNGVFSHLKPKTAYTPPPVNIPTITMTWEKFRRIVLPHAEQIEINAPSHGRYIALTTAVHADAPLIFKWGNPVAWYVYANGASARDFNLSAGWNKVVAVSPLPTLWGPRPQPHLSEGHVLVIEGCVDRRNGSLGLFPECLRSELHAVRSTIEAHSRSGRLSGREQASACGYDIRKSHADCELRVFEKNTWIRYRIDRWD